MNLNNCCCECNINPTDVFSMDEFFKKKSEVEIKKSNSNEGVFNSIVGLNVSTDDGNMTIDHCKYVFLTEDRGKLILNLQYELDIPET